MELQAERPNSSTLILRINGRFDAHTVGQVKLSWLNEESVKYVIADLAQTTFIDSMGLAALANGLKIAMQRGGNFIIANPSKIVQSIMELTLMNRAFHVVSSVDAGLHFIESA